jgi:predicted site-specific integrase-resolvase
MKAGYARVSTKDQIVDLQVDDRMPNTEDPYEAVYN